MELEADTCNGCGQSLRESTHPDAEGQYEVPEPTRCHSCTPLNKMQQKYAEAPAGLLFETHRQRR